MRVSAKGPAAVIERFDGASRQVAGRLPVEVEARDLKKVRTDMGSSSVVVAVNG
jgi:hypothetical protein